MRFIFSELSNFVSAQDRWEKLNRCRLINFNYFFQSVTFGKYSLYLQNHLQQVWNVHVKKLQGIFRLKKEADDNLGFWGSPLLSPVSNVARRWNFGQMVSTMSMAVTCRCCRDFRRRLEPPRGPLATLSPTRSTNTTTWITRTSPWGHSACYTQWFSRETAYWSQLPFQSDVAPEKNLNFE